MTLLVHLFALFLLTFMDKRRLWCLLSFLGHLLVSFLNIFASLQWVPTRAVMDSDCLCHLLFWSFCSELWRKVKHWNLWHKFCLTIVLQWAVVVYLIVYFLLQAEEILIITQKTKSLTGIIFEVFAARCFPVIWFGIFLYLCFSLWVTCCCLLTCNWSILNYNSLCLWLWPLHSGSCVDLLLHWSVYMNELSKWTDFPLQSYNSLSIKKKKKKTLVSAWGNK